MRAKVSETLCARARACVCNSERRYTGGSGGRVEGANILGRECEMNENWREMYIGEGRRVKERRSRELELTILLDLSVR